jgi:23S rRNA (pseudouridine1915-N3)-methyltransferase
MLQITILMVGKTREGFIREGLVFYQKRLKPFLNLDLVSVRAEKESASFPPHVIKARETMRLLSEIPPRSWSVALDPQGRQFTTEEFAAWLALKEEEARPLTFLIGGHLGLDTALLHEAHDRLALSRLTLTHELSRLVLLEQLYRAMTIKSGHPYHV